MLIISAPFNDWRVLLVLEGKALFRIYCITYSKTRPSMLVRYHECFLLSCECGRRREGGRYSESRTCSSVPQYESCDATKIYGAPGVYSGIVTC